jgi:aldehyde:ferredoxin oxidoreductase
MHGWTGKLLRVNLTEGTTRAEPINKQWAIDYIGGRGLGAKYLFEEMDPNVDPLSPENKLIFATGPLTGTNSSCGCRYMVVTKGALNGTITTSNSGGHWGPALKYAGYDLVILEGRSPRPVYLWIYDGEVEIRSARHLWGKSAWDTEDLVREELGVPSTHVACIGQAGENLVKFASIMNDKHRAAGRNGVGAVMGSKQLKAIAVCGTGAVELADPAGFHQAQWAMKAKLKGSPVTGEGLPTYGTAVLVNVINESGAMPTKNFQYAQMNEESTGSNVENISGETIHDTVTVRNKACFACTIACGRVTKISDEGREKHLMRTTPKNWRVAGEGPEYESAWSLGADTNIDDLDAVLKANFMCNEYGMDPISFGATVAAAMELYERGVIDDGVTGMPLPFGAADALVRLTHMTAMQEGFGRELAEGSKRMTEKFGRPEYFMGSKGMEFPAYDPRAVQGMGLGYATSNRGGCHLKAYTVSAEIMGIPEKLDPQTSVGKAAVTIAFQNITSAFDSSGLCIFLTFGIGAEDMLPELRAATGVDYTMETMILAGERIYNLERLWLLRAGFTGADDKLPLRMTDPAQAIPAGPTKGQSSKLAEMLPEYYQLRGWTEDGEPTEAKLEELGLAETSA